MAQYQPTISDTMLGIVSTVLNSGSDKTFDISGKSITIKEYPKFANYNIECKFKGTDINGKSFTLEPIQINRFLIDQDYAGAFLDHIEINISLRPVDLLLMYDSYQDLLCDITLRHVDPKTGVVKGKDAPGEQVCTLSNYRVLFKNKQDIRKILPKQSLVPEEQGDFNITQQDMLFSDITLQLISKADYLVRLKSFSFQLFDATVKHAIFLVAKLCDITKIAIVEPDNQKVIRNLVLPPLKTFSSSLEYIQSVWGVYNKDLGYYFSKDVLYIYPKYDINPKLPVKADEGANAFYFIGGMKFPGLEVNHAVDTTNASHIIVNAANINRDLVDSGIENDGTVTMIMHADRVIDQWRTMREGTTTANAETGFAATEIPMNVNTSLFSITEEDKKRLGIAPDVTFVKYAFDESNPYKTRVPINRYQRTVIQTAWENAVPFTFKPGYKILWNYDSEYAAGRSPGDKVAKNYKYCSKPGVVDSVAYMFKPAARLNNEWTYTCTASLTLSIEPDKASPTDAPGISSTIPETTANKMIEGPSAHKLAATRHSSIDTVSAQSDVSFNPASVKGTLADRIEDVKKSSKLLNNTSIFKQ